MLVRVDKNNASAKYIRPALDELALIGVSPQAKRHAGRAGSAVLYPGIPGRGRACGRRAQTTAPHILRRAATADLIRGL